MAKPEDIGNNKVVPDLSWEQILQKYGVEGTELHRPFIYGGTISGATYRTLDTDATFEIFPEGDKNTGMIVKDDAGSQVFKIEVGGTNVGDVTMGDYANDKGAQWDKSASAFNVKGTVTTTAGTIGGWTLGANALTAGSGATTVGLDSGGTNPAIYAGSATPGSAPFRVTQAGALTATTVTVTGTVTATGGAIQTGCNIGSTDAATVESKANDAFQKTTDDADNITESASKKWAAETGADITADHQAATIASQGGLATRNVAFEQLGASDTLEESADTERSRQASTYAMVKEIVIRLGGTIRIKFDIKGDSPSFAPAVAGRIYANGTAIGTERTSGDNTYDTHSEDLHVQPFDLVQLYHKGNGTNYCYIRNFRIYYTKSATPAETTVNTD